MQTDTVAGAELLGEDTDAFLLSQLTQAGYCLRRAALVMNEQLWQESGDTAKGRLEHQRTHERRMERRGEQVLLYNMEVCSRRLGLRGQCDCIEATASDEGCAVPGIPFPVRLYPVEYKHGKVRTEREYEMQLCAQAMCLEEMFGTEIGEGAIFYTTSHRRFPVALTAELRRQVGETVARLREIRDHLRLPAAEYGPRCKKCSLRELCLPQLNRSAVGYCDTVAREAKEGIRR